MFKIVRQSQADVRHIGHNKSAANYIAKDDNAGMSFAVIQATDFAQDEITYYNRIYHVLEGELTLVFGDQTHLLQPGDTCLVYKETAYHMGGTFKAVVVNQPAFEK